MEQVGPRDSADPGADRTQSCILTLRKFFAQQVFRERVVQAGAEQEAEANCALATNLYRTIATERDNELDQRNVTYRYIQFDVSRLGLPVNHSGANVIQPGGAVNHVSASACLAMPTQHNSFAARADPHIRLTK